MSSVFETLPQGIGWKDIEDHSWHQPLPLWTHTHTSTLAPHKWRNMHAHTHEKWKKSHKNYLCNVSNAKNETTNSSVCCPVWKVELLLLTLQFLHLLPSLLFWDASPPIDCCSVFQYVSQRPLINVPGSNSQAPWEGSQVGHISCLKHPCPLPFQGY